MSEKKSNVIIFPGSKRKNKEDVKKGIGLCAVFSRQGDWAFDYALSLARLHHTRLNIFHFLSSPYRIRRDVVFADAEQTRTRAVTPAFIEEKDKEMRERFEDRLGDYAEVGFRLCEGNDEFELKKCFRKGEYAILVIAYQKKGAKFGGTTTIEEFAKKFKGPLVLVGPDSPDTLYINGPAHNYLTDLLLEGKHLEVL